MSGRTKPSLRIGDLRMTCVSCQRQCGSEPTPVLTWDRRCLVGRRRQGQHHSGHRVDFSASPERVTSGLLLRKSLWPY